MYSIKSFQKHIWDFYHIHRRDFPWRPPTLKLKRGEVLDPYYVLVSEVMLQQTQADRVRRVYPAFIKKFSSFHTLARASTVDVLRAWQGLGYNRRALNIHRLAKIVVAEYKGKLPQISAELDALPGIGKGTTGSLLAFVFNKPAVFIETNIRRVFIHHFFPKKEKVHDDEILKLVEKSLPAGKQAREWYYALMDYGAWLGIKEKENPNKRSKHYKKQSAFEGSDRQIRGALIKLLLKSGTLAVSRAYALSTKKRVVRILAKLKEENFISIRKDYISIITGRTIGRR